MAGYGTRGAGYGLDAALAKQRESRYDLDDEADAQAWIEAVTGEEFGEDEAFAAALKDGTKLCKLVNAIRPGSVRKINASRTPFKQMENISMFLRAIRALGVAEHDCFETVDLYEEKDLGVVVKCIWALGRAAQTSCPEFGGPHLGQAENWNRNAALMPKHEVKPGGAGVMPKLAMGSAQFMERSSLTYHDFSAGARYSGTGADGSVPVLSKASSATMERPSLNYHDFSAGARYSGASADSSVPMLSKASSVTMERAPVLNTGVTLGADAAAGRADVTIANADASAANAGNADAEASEEKKDALPEEEGLAAAAPEVEA
mmetsp:Transcript_45244/g.141782  ORF Transcript_45244/g.141782 Transcript_45244/m.141782 type:complete len:319 (-) Transcript_45244:1665-2621(-)